MELEAEWFYPFTFYGFKIITPDKTSDDFKRLIAKLSKINDFIDSLENEDFYIRCIVSNFHNKMDTYSFEQLLDFTIEHSDIIIGFIADNNLSNHQKLFDELKEFIKIHSDKFKNIHIQQIGAFYCGNNWGLLFNEYDAYYEESDEDPS